VRIQRADLVGERAGLVDLVGDDAVGAAPVQLKRNAGERDAPDVVVRAPQLVGTQVGPRRAADLAPREALQHPPARKRGEVAVAAFHVGCRVERGCTGKQLRVSRNEQERLLTAHRTADRIDAADAHAVRLRDLRHPRQVVDLAGVAPRVEPSPPSLAGGVDHREAALARQVTPQIGVLGGADPASVRRDDERDRRAVVAGGQEQPRRTHDPVVRAVADANRARQRLRPRAQRGLRRCSRYGDQCEHERKRNPHAWRG
jgi:hypothetical protein